MTQNKFGLRILYRNGSKDFQWYIEESLRNTEYKRYKRSWAVKDVIKINR